MQTNPFKIMTYTETVNRARRSNSNSRLADLQAVTNAARRAHKNVSANEAIALYCGYKLQNLRSFKQCLEMGLKPAEIHTLPTIDIWGINSPEWCERTGAAKYYPKAAFDCTDILRVDSHDPAADIPAEPMDNTDTAPKSDLISQTEEAEAIADTYFQTDTPAETPTAGKRGGKGGRRGRKQEAAPAPALTDGTEDDLPF